MTQHEITELTSFPNKAISLCPGSIFPGNSLSMTMPEFISFSGSNNVHLVQLSIATSTATDVSVSANLCNDYNYLIMSMYTLSLKFNLYTIENYCK